MPSLKNIGKNRYLEISGGDYEDFKIGTEIDHRPGRTITESDNTWFTLLTMNQHPIHFDHSYAEKTIFKKPLVNSTLTLSIITGMSVSSTSQRAIANLGWERITLPNPVFIGDTVYAKTKIISKRLSNSKPDRGIVSVKTQGYNQKSTLILEMNRSFLVYKRKYSID